MEDTNDLKRLLIVISFVAILILTILYLTYSINQNNPQKTITANILKLDESAYGETEFNNENLDLKPILDKNATKDSSNLIYIEFNVGGAKENNAEEIIYDIALADLELDCNLLSPYLKWKLIRNNLELSQGTLDYKFDTIEKGRLVLTNIQQDLVPFNEDKTKYDHFEFYLWISDSCQEENINKCQEAESQANLLGRKITGKIEVELYGGSKKELIRKPQETLNTDTCITN